MEVDTRVETELFWIITLPNSALGRQGIEELSQKTKGLCKSNVTKFNIPALRVGTLDSLMTLSDELAKKDTFVEMTTKKIARQLVDLSADESKEAKNKDKYQLIVNGAGVDSYMHQFQWDEAKYKVTSPLSDIVDAIVSMVSKAEEELRTKASSYQHVTQLIVAEQRKQTGNLMVRDITALINPEEYVDTINLCTLFVVVPKYQQKDWLSTYESLLDEGELGGGVIPGSATVITEDNDNQLYSIIIFKRLTNEFKTAARKKRFNVRDFVYKPEEANDGQEEQKRLESKREKQKKNMIRWCRMNFAECFIAWTHLKTIRAFVETILRYGLPADFTAILLHPNTKYEKKLRTTLDAMYKGIGTSYLRDERDDEEGDSSSALGEKFYSYVSDRKSVV